MCTQSEFAAMRERIVEVEKANIAQGEQVKALCESVKELKETVQGAFSKLLWICAVVMPAATEAYGLAPVEPTRRTVEVEAFCSWSACRMKIVSIAFARTGFTS